MKRITSIYSIIVGVSMFSFWLMFFITDQIPELKTEPIRILSHITAEIVTALCLIIAGVSLLRNVKWSKPFYMLSMGMLLYTLIQSPGYFAQKGDFAFVGMFVVFLACSIFFIISLFKSN